MIGFYAAGAMGQGGGGGPSTFDSLVLGHSPTAYWKMDEVAGSTAIDSSGNARHGTYVGSPSFSEAALFGAAARSTHLDSSSYVTLPDAALVSGANARSVGLFLSVDDVAVVTQFPVSWGTASASRGWSLELGRNGAGSFGVNRHGTGWIYASTSGLFSDDQPLFLVAVFTGSRVQCYINGAQVLDTSSGAGNTAAADGAIGRRIYSTANPCEGRYSNVFVMAKALSPAEVSALWAARNAA